MKSQKGKEKEFKHNLGSCLSKLGIEVYYHEDFGPKFTISRATSYVDMYLIMPETWIYRSIFPAISIEVKTAESLGQLVKALDQLKDQRVGEDSVYFIDGIEVPSPTINLIATPESFHRGDIYEWAAYGVQNWPEDFSRGVWKGITELYDRILWKYRCAILRQNRFLYQQKYYDLNLKRSSQQEGLKLGAILPKEVKK